MCCTQTYGLCPEGQDTDLQFVLRDPQIHRAGNSAAAAVLSLKLSQLTKNQVQGDCPVLKCQLIGQTINPVPYDNFLTMMQVGCAGEPTVGKATHEWGIVHGLDSAIAL